MIKPYLSVLLLSFVFSFILCLILIPVLRRQKAGQNILSYVKEHVKKSGTPTMGGLAFLFASCLALSPFISLEDRNTLVAVTVTLAFTFVGFIDDFLKLKHGKNLGLTALQKTLFQLAVAIVACIYLYRSGATKIYIPFTLVLIDLNLFFLPLGIFVFYATVNSVNLTDGLDGLASATCIPFFFFLGVVMLLEGQEGGMPVFCFSLVGALLAYLIFNVSRASVFMGDTGSLGLGGAVAVLPLMTGNAFYIPILGVMFVLSSISVILQVIYYKKTGKRLFKMAPIHHHFEEKGYSESKISYAYFTVTFLLGVVAVFFLL